MSHHWQAEIYELPQALHAAIPRARAPNRQEASAVPGLPEQLPQYYPQLIVFEIGCGDPLHSFEKDSIAINLFTLYSAYLT
jgi:hypothetical protein